MAHEDAFALIRALERLAEKRQRTRAETRHRNRRKRRAAARLLYLSGEEDRVGKIIKDHCTALLAEALANPRVKG